MAIFGPKPLVKPSGKISIIRLVELLVFIAQKGVFSFQNIVKHISLAYILKKTMEKWPFLDQNHWLTALEKSQFFRLVELFFIAWKRVFWLQNIVTYIYLYFLKKLEKWPFLDQNHGLTPQEKCQFFDFLDFLFLQPRQAFFRSRIS